MPTANQSTAFIKITASEKSTSSYATIMQDAANVTDEAIKMSFANRKDSVMTTSVHEHESAKKTHHEFVSHGQGDRKLSLAEVVNFPVSNRQFAVTFHALQEWEGYITGINDTEFSANLVDLTAGASHEKEEADIPIEELSEDDISKIQVGSIFRWVIGYERSAAGTKKRVSHIVLRDLPAITKTDLSAGEKWARKIMDAFKL